MAKELSRHAAAAKAIRAELKARGITGRVRAKSYAGGSSVDVFVTDLDPAKAEELKGFCGQFEMGHFDGMTDLYEYSNTRKDLPQVKFVFVHNRRSEEMTGRLWSYAREYFAGPNRLPADYAEAENCYIEPMRCYPSDLIHRIFCGSCGDFWKVAA